jgi:hypothetical protein
MKSMQNETGTPHYNSAITVPRDHVVAYVYFITCEYPDFPIKIGYAANPKARLASIGIMLPYPVVTLAVVPGSRRLERKLHKKFADSQMMGEWFRRTPELMALIEAAAAGKRLFPPGVIQHLTERQKEQIRRDVCGD